MILKGSLLNEYPTLSGTLSKVDTKAYPPYTGSYDIIPKAFEEQALQTANKTLTKNIIIKKIPYVETHNETDGLTVYIAKEV